MSDEKVTFELHRAEAQMLCDILEKCSDEFSNHTCNDYPAENTDENWAIYTEIEIREDEENRCLERPVRSKPIYFMDWALMEFLREKIENQLEGNDV